MPASLWATILERALARGDRADPLWRGALPLELDLAAPPCGGELFRQVHMHRLEERLLLTGGEIPPGAILPGSR